jgi:hypothetical protein
MGWRAQWWRRCVNQVLIQLPGNPSSVDFDELIPFRVGDIVEKRIMKVTVNRTEIEIFQGATAGDAIRAYYSRHGQRVPTPLPEVRDAYGNLVAHDGALTEGNRLRVNVTFPSKRRDAFTLKGQETGIKQAKNQSKTDEI